jgi:hypothetical protein
MNQWSGERKFKMQNIIGNTTAVVFMGLCLAMFPHNPAHAEAEVKQVCHDKLDIKGQFVKDKYGMVVQDCKKIKVHKKLEGTTVPDSKKK